GGEYYIFPATLDHHKGGLRLAKTGDSKCPDTILQNVNITGLPVKFTIPNISNGIILIGGLNCKDVMRKDFKDGESRLVVSPEHLRDPYPVVFVDAPSFESGIAMDVKC
ncbi:kunitz-type trypsin inhibitor-like 2 protein, partial [Trifolium pratense]